MSPKFRQMWQKVPSITSVYIGANDKESMFGIDDSLLIIIHSHLPFVSVVSGGYELAMYIAVLKVISINQTQLFY